MRETVVERSSGVCFESVREWNDTFLTLFPHRFDYIYAPYPNAGETPAWRTESRHPLSDRLIRQSAYLYGVRLGAETNYCLLDIDIGSSYHPKQDFFAISRIAAALEPLGLTSYVACTSSYSGGLHLYFPFQMKQSSWQLAIALACLLENAGFKIQPGQLEVFPNPKPYAIDGNISLFNAHRLPLQIGSYLLDREFQPIWSDDQSFVNQWESSQQHNDLDGSTLKQILKQAKRKQFGISGNAEKFINDLNAEIEVGWTDHGQTNRLLGRITMRAYIFHHILSGGKPLQGKALIDEIVETARSLPGYQEWCRHQHEIEHRAEEWARCIENSHYFHYGEQNRKPQPEVQDPVLAAAIEASPSWNQRRSAATRDRIRQAIADLLEQNHLPIKPTARFQALLNYGIGGGSLYRHRDLWHPAYFGLDTTQNVPQNVEDNWKDNWRTSVEIGVTNTDQITPPYPPNIKSDGQLDCIKNASNCLSQTSLLPINDGNHPSHQPSSDRASICSETDANNSPVSSAAQFSAPEPLEGVQFVQQVVFNIKAAQEAFQAAAHLAQTQHQQIQSEAAAQRQIARMQQFLDSGDPILIAEALAWAQVNPNVLRMNRRQDACTTKLQN